MSPLMPVPPEKMAVYRKTARKKHLHRLRLREKRQAAALVFAKKSAEFLKSTYGVDKVILFGSLARQGIFDDHSDVDLAVLGLDERIYYRALAQLMNMRPDIDIDLIRMEETTSGLLESIHAGIVL